MSDDWKKPWLDTARVLNVIAAHTAAAVVIAAILFGADAALKSLHAEETKWLSGTVYQFDMSTLFHAADLGIITLFVVFGVYHGFRDMQ